MVLHTERIDKVHLAMFKGSVVGNPRLTQVILTLNGPGMIAGNPDLASAM
jgi:hypothetical protein